MSSLEISRLRRVQLVLTAALLVVGTAVALLLAHAYDASHGRGTEQTAIGVESVHVISMPDTTSTHDVDPVDTRAVSESSPFADSLALCVSLGMGCVTALLLALLRLRRPPTSRHTTVANQPQKPARTPERRWVPEPALSALCVIRV